VLVDLHAHYPMHLPMDGKPGAHAWMTDTHRTGFWEKIRALLLKILNDHDNFPDASGANAVLISVDQGRVAPLRGSGAYAQAHSAARWALVHR
jgi:hypothetical protein